MCWGQFLPESFHFYVFKCIKISFYCFWVCLIRRVFSILKLHIQKNHQLCFFVHLLFGIQVFNSSGIYFGGRLRKVIYFVFLTVLPVPIQVIELLHQWSEIPAFPILSSMIELSLLLGFPAVLLTSLLKNIVSKLFHYL